MEKRWLRSPTRYRCKCTLLHVHYGEEMGAYRDKWETWRSHTGADEPQRETLLRHQVQICFQYVLTRSLDILHLGNVSSV